MLVLAVQRLRAPSAPPKPAATQAVIKDPCALASTCTHIVDSAGAVDPADVPRFNHYLGNILRESGIDIRLLFVRGTGARSIETLAVQAMDELHIGGQTQHERGLLVLFDVEQRRLKIEVGYGLEAYFPDAFVGYLVDEHARLFFETDRVTTGLRLMLRLLQHRIREAVLGGDFDPRVLQALRSTQHFSGGAGVSATMAPAAPPGIGTQAPGLATASSSMADASPVQAYANYLRLLFDAQWNPDADVFTAQSRAYLRQLPLSPAYRQFILLGEYGKRYRIEERGDRALLIFTDTPFVSPHFLVREDGLWRIDIAAEVRNTVEHVGGAYTWAYRGAGDVYSERFGDLLVNLQGYRRFRAGDNRALPIRGAVQTGTAKRG